MSMSFRPFVEADYEEILSMMKVFYASDALLIHPQEATLRRTLTDVISDDPFVQGFAFEYEGVLAGYGMIAKSYSTEAGGHCVWIEDIQEMAAELSYLVPKIDFVLKGHIEDNID